jgi:hypothetical protein
MQKGIAKDEHWNLKVSKQDDCVQRGTQETTLMLKGKEARSPVKLYRKKEGCRPSIRSE